MCTQAVLQFLSLSVGQSERRSGVQGDAVPQILGQLDTFSHRELAKFGEIDAHDASLPQAA